MESCLVPETVRPPVQAYSYWPDGDYVYFGQNEKIVRFIFYRVNFTAYELN